MEESGVGNGDSASIAGSDLEGPTADSIRMVGIRKAPGEHLGITVKENDKGELAIARWVISHFKFSGTSPWFLFHLSSSCTDVTR